MGGHAKLDKQRLFPLLPVLLQITPLPFESAIVQRFALEGM